MHKGVLGLVIEIQSNGVKGVYDFFELTRIGNQIIERCSRNPNCITTAQHESCVGKKIYQSAKDKVSLDDFYTLNVSNFMSKAIETFFNQPTGEGLSVNQMDFEEVSNSTDGLGELSDDSTVANNVSNDPDITEETVDDRMDTEEPNKKTNCYCCNKAFINLYSHLSRSYKCKEIYGEEFNALKKERDENAKASKNMLKRKRRAQNKAKKQKENADYQSQNSARVSKRKKLYYKENTETIRESQKSYKSQNAESLKEDHRRYNT